MGMEYSIGWCILFHYQIVSVPVVSALCCKEYCDSIAIVNIIFIFFIIIMDSKQRERINFTPDEKNLLKSLLPKYPVLTGRATVGLGQKVSLEKKGRMDVVNERVQRTATA